MVQHCLRAASGPLLVTLVALQLFCNAAAAPSLFAPTGDSNARTAGPQQKAGAVKGRHATVRMNVEALAGTSGVSLNLPWQSKPFEAVAGIPGSAGATQRAAADPSLAGTWVGTVANESYSLVALHGKDGGHIFLKGKTIAVEPAATNGEWDLYEIDEASRPTAHPLPPTGPPGVTAPPRKPQHMNAAARTTADPDGQVDIAIFYTKNALDKVGETTLEAQIRAAVASSNAIYAASQLKPRLNIVFIGLVSHTWRDDKAGHSMSDTLNVFANPNDGILDRVWEVRDRYGADNAMLISDDSSYCGLGYIMQNVQTFGWPFAVVSVGCLPGSTLTHELGHNFGMQHDHDQFVSGTPYKPSSFGYRVPGQFGTLMAYPCNANCNGCAPCPRIPYFSNPNLAPVSARSAKIGKAGWADATATINDPPVLRMMANLGQRRDPGTPVRPTNLTVSMNGSKQMVLKWKAGTNGAHDSFVVYRQINGGAWRRLIVVANSKSVSYTDGGGTKANTTYCYRVKAANYKRASTLTASACRKRTA